MGFTEWLRGRRATWQPLAPNRFRIGMLVGVLLVFLVVGIFDLRAWLGHGTGWHAAARGVLLAGTEVVIVVALLAQHTRFQLTARLLTFSAFPLLVWLFYLRHIWAR